MIKDVQYTKKEYFRIIRKGYRTMNIKDQYNAFLDEVGFDNLYLPPVHIVLKEIDPVQYEQGFLDYCDAEGIDTDSLINGNC